MTLARAVEAADSAFTETLAVCLLSTIWSHFNGEIDDRSMRWAGTAVAVRRECRETSMKMLGVDCNYLLYHHCHRAKAPTRVAHSHIEGSTNVIGVGVASLTSETLTL